MKQNHIVHHSARNSEIFLISLKMQASPAALTYDEKMLPNYVPIYVMLPVSHQKELFSISNILITIISMVICFSVFVVNTSWELLQMIMF